MAGAAARADATLARGRTRARHLDPRRARGALPYTAAMASRSEPGPALDDERSILTVTALNREARLIIESGLGRVWVEGEISNVARPSSGHMYFTLKDARAQVRCAMFRQENRRLRFALEDGQQVVVRGRVSLYETRGDFQLIVDSVEDSGEGLLRRRFEELKAKLAAEGLFEAERKRALPQLPARIGVVTSSTGAALRDVLISLRRRFPALPVLVYPTSVQGDAAPAEITAALELADRRAECDLVILTRGGGSLEDLQAFNDERVARAVAAMSIPVVVGVGHESDFTIADFVADLRAPTPSQAAELAVPDAAEWLAAVTRYSTQLARAMQRRLADTGRRLDTLAHRLRRAHPGVLLRTGQQRLDELELRARRALMAALEQRRLRLERLDVRLRHASPARRIEQLEARFNACETDLAAGMRRLLEQRAQRLRLAERSLSSLSPLATLERGYAIVARRDDGRIVRDPGAALPGTGLDIRVAEGGLRATVDDDPGDSER